MIVSYLEANFYVVRNLTYNFALVPQPIGSYHCMRYELNWTHVDWSHPLPTHESYIPPLRTSNSVSVNPFVRKKNGSAKQICPSSLIQCFVVLLIPSSITFNSKTISCTHI